MPGMGTRKLRAAIPMSSHNNRPMISRNNRPMISHNHRPMISLKSRASARRQRVNERLVPFRHFIRTVFLIKSPCRMRSCAGRLAIGLKSKSWMVFRTLQF